MTALFGMLAYLRAFVIVRHRLGMEAVALRQQLVVYKRKQPRPKLDRFDRLFWVVVRQIWANWSESLILVKPEAVVAWHRARYRLFWKWRSRRQRLGRPKIAEEVRDLIRRMMRLDPPHERRESDVGRAAHPWRVACTRLRDLGTHSVALSAALEASSER